MQRIRSYALAATICVFLASYASEAQAQLHAINKSTAQSRASVTIVDGISLGVRSSHQDRSELSIHSNGLKATVMTRSAGKLFRESFTASASEFVIESTRKESADEVLVAFE